MPKANIHLFLNILDLSWCIH